VAGKPTNHLPLGISYLDKKPYLGRNYSDTEDIVKGSELVSINGMSTGRLG
jgi:hypothetical protein